MYRIDLGTEVAVLNSQVVPISQVVLKAGFTVLCPISLISGIIIPFGYYVIGAM